MTRLRTAAAFVVLTLAAPLVVVAGFKLDGEVTPPAPLRTVASLAVDLTPAVVAPRASRYGRSTVTTVRPAPARSAQTSAPVAHTSKPTPRTAGEGRTTVPRPSPADTIPAKWQALVNCEAPGRGWRYGAPGVGIDPGYQFYGGPNFTQSTWEAFGGLRYAYRAYDATPAQQITVAERVLAVQGWRAWPTCSKRLGYR